MDLATLILVEISFIELLILVILLSLLASKRKPGKTEEEYEAEANEIAKEAEAIASVSAKVRSPQKAFKVKYEETKEEGERKTAWTIIKENILVLIIIVLLGIAFETYKNYSTISKWLFSVFVYLDSSWLRVAAIIIVVLAILLLGYLRYRLAAKQKKAAKKKRR